MGRWHEYLPPINRSKLLPSRGLISNTLSSDNSFCVCFLCHVLNFEIKNVCKVCWLLYLNLTIHDHRLVKYIKL